MSDALALVVLAAGASRRLGRCKATVPLGRSRTPPVVRLLRAGAALAEPLVVTGKDHDEIERVLSTAAVEPVELARNDDWARGRSGTVRRARDLRPGRDLCLAPVDVPLVSSSVFDRLRSTWLAAACPPRGWLAPYFLDDGERRFGHPVVIGRELLAELDASWDGRSLRDLRARAAPLLATLVDEPGIADDLDTPADLERLERLERLARTD